MTEIKKIPLFEKLIMTKQDIGEKLKIKQESVKNQKENIKMKDHELTKLLKQTLTGEMYHALLNLVVSPHLILKLFLFVFLAISYGLASYTMITLIVTYFDYGVNNNCKNDL